MVVQQLRSENPWDREKSSSPGELGGEGIEPGLELAGAGAPAGDMLT